MKNTGYATCRTCGAERRNAQVELRNHERATGHHGWDIEDPDAVAFREGRDAYDAYAEQKRSER